MEEKSTDQGQQGTVTSDQAPPESSQDQAAEQSWSAEVGGRVYNNPDDVVKDYENLQKQFTKVTQEKQPPEKPQELDEVDQVADLLTPKLSAKGFVTKEELKLETYLAKNPDVDANKLRKLASDPDYKTKAYEDIVAEWNLNTVSGPTGTHDPKGMPKKVGSSTERDKFEGDYETWRKEKLDSKFL